jgi:nucleoside permease NupC
LSFAGVGAAFVFGPLGNGTVWGRVMTGALGPDGAQYATIFAFQARMALNEFVAYSELGPLKGSIDPKSFTSCTFALCGFANFSSIGIQIGGIGALAPNRRHDLAWLGLRAMFAGTLANFMTATIAGFLL